jgi:hypothetical protein
VISDNQGGYDVEIAIASITTLKKCTVTIGELGVDKVPMELEGGVSSTGSHLVKIPQLQRGIDYIVRAQVQNEAGSDSSYVYFKLP